MYKKFKEFDAELFEILRIEVLNGVFLNLNQGEIS